MIFKRVSVCAAIATCVPAALALECANPSELVKQLDQAFSNTSAIGCIQSELQQENAKGYWGIQYAKNASIVAYPSTAEDVAAAIQAFVNSPEAKGMDFAVGGGLHGQTGASATDGFMLDLRYLNQTEIVLDALIDGATEQVITYEGGARWRSVLDTTAGTGYTAVGARDSSVGVGGFSTGGGIGFLAGAHGFAGDRLVAMDAVLMNGSVVHATKKNEYADLFWAIQGGGGQFGIVSKFYQKVAEEPKLCHFHGWVVDEASEAQLWENTRNFFESNTDPFALIYVSHGYTPSDFNNPSVDLAPRTSVIALQFEDPSETSQPAFYDIFGNTTLLKGVTALSEIVYDVPYANVSDVIDPLLPYGLRRGFWGGQTTNVTTDFFRKGKEITKKWVESLVEAGDPPFSGAWIVQYLHPGFSGNLPATDEETAWPHSVAGHQTLFAPGWSNAANDAQTLATNTALNEMVYEHQKSVGPVLADYPNYISPDADGERVWGSNVQRLIDIKEKYDPECLLAAGRVFASPGCINRGKANIFAGGSQVR